jgi:hypothetical protein
MEESNFQKFKQFSSNIFTYGILKIRSYYTYIMIAFFVIIFLLMGMGTIDNLRLMCSNRKLPVIVSDKQPYEANYKSDMNFLECIGEQHNCLYKNLSNGIEANKILEKCKDENYCNQNSRSIHVRIPK